jgi:hypothetical protein
MCDSVNDESGKWGGAEARRGEGGRGWNVTWEWARHTAVVWTHRRYSYGRGRDMRCGGGGREVNKVHRCDQRETVMSWEGRNVKNG